MTTPALTALAERAKAFADQARAFNTRRSIESSWRAFSKFCTTHGLTALPAAPETVALFLTARADELATGSLSCALSGIKAKHDEAGYRFDAEAPAFAEVWDGIRRTKGVRRKGKDALMPEDIRRMVDKTGTELVDLRNKALLLIGYASAMRRSELVAVDVEHLRFENQGVVITIPFSKADQYGQGQTVAVAYGEDPAYCPVRALKTWLAKARITTGAVFIPVGTWKDRERLSDKSVAKVVKKLAEDAGLDPARYAGHSLRAGVCTAAEDAGVPLEDRMRHLRHTRVTTTLKYSRRGHWSGVAAKAVV